MLVAGTIWTFSNFTLLYCQHAMTKDSVQKPLLILSEISNYSLAVNVAYFYILIKYSPIDLVSLFLVRVATWWLIGDDRLWLRDSGWMGTSLTTLLLPSLPPNVPFTAWTCPLVSGELSERADNDRIELLRWTGRANVMKRHVLLHAFFT